MLVGLLTLDLHFPEAHSLKSKRKVLKGIKDRIRSRFNVSVAEVDGNDLWQRSLIGIACVANETKFINSVFDDIIGSTILANPSVELIDSAREML
jgi:uncharacterized protein YlxP (DUF503 family)